MESPGIMTDRTRLVLGRIKARRTQISFTYLLTLIENAFELMYPWAIGIAINGLLIDKWQLLVPLIAIWLAHILVGGLRQLYDTRLFSRLYAAMATDIIDLQRQDGEEVSQVSARVDMAEEFVDFFEAEMPVIFATAVSLFGSLIFLFFYDIWSGLIITGLFLPIGLINIITGRRALKMNEAYNNQWEEQVDIISRAHPRSARRHFGGLAKWKIHLSDIEVFSWTSTGILTLGATILVLVRVADIPGILAGDIFASLAYVLRIEQSLDRVPETVQQIGRLFDIRSRIRSL
jgi:ABC-type multidrug transport system fused ATPase/permease subunit